MSLPSNNEKEEEIKVDPEPIIPSVSLQVDPTPLPATAIPKVLKEELDWYFLSFFAVKSTSPIQQGGSQMVSTILPHKFGHFLFTTKIPAQGG